MMKATRTILFLMLVICLPFLIITTALRWEISDIRLYQNGFEKYGISVVTGIDEQQLEGVAQHLIKYFNSKVDSVQYTVIRGGQQFTIFNEKEIIHLEDVRNLVQLDYRIQLLVFLLMIACVLVLWLGFKERWLALIKSLFWGSIITLGLMIFLAFWAIIGFERLFILFHQASFSNKYWILDPSKDYLIMMFPGGFFYDMALLGFGAVILVSLIIGAASFGTMRISDAKKQHCA
jgi:integral membrane protein (TIGR01906 family)